MPVSGRNKETCPKKCNPNKSINLSPNKYCSKHYLEGVFEFLFERSRELIQQFILPTSRIRPLHTGNSHLSPHVLHVQINSKKKRRTWTDFNIQIKGIYKSYNNINYSKSTNTTLSIRTRYLNCKCPHLRVGKSYLLLGRMSKDSSREKDGVGKIVDKSAENKQRQDKTSPEIVDKSNTVQLAARKKRSINTARSRNYNRYSNRYSYSPSSYQKQTQPQSSVASNSISDNRPQKQQKPTKPKSRSKYTINSNPSSRKILKYIKSSRNTIAIPWKGNYKRKLKRIVRKVKREKKCKTF